MKGSKARLGWLVRCSLLAASICLLSGTAFAQCAPTLPLSSANSVPCFITVQPIDVCSCSAFTGTTCTGTKSCAPFNTTSTNGVGNPSTACTPANQTSASCANPIGFVVNPSTGLSPGQTGYSSGTTPNVDVTRTLLLQGGVDMVLENMEEYDSPNGVTVSGNYQTLTVTQTPNTVATCTGSIAGTVLTIPPTPGCSGSVAVFDVLSNTAGTIASGTTIAGFGTGTGGAGTYLVTPSQTVASGMITVSTLVQQSTDFLKLAQQVPSATTSPGPPTAPCAISQMTIPPGSNGNLCGAPTFPRNPDPGIINLFFVNTLVPPSGTGTLYGFSYIGNNGAAIAEDTFGYPRVGKVPPAPRPDTIVHELWHDQGLEHTGNAAGPFTPPPYNAPEGVVGTVPLNPSPLECDTGYPACQANLMTTGLNRTSPYVQCMFLQSLSGTLPTGCNTSSATVFNGKADQLTLAAQENAITGGTNLPESQQRVVLQGNSGLLLPCTSGSPCPSASMTGFLNPIPHVTTKAQLEPGDGPADRAVFDLSGLTDGRPGETLVAWILTLPQEQTFAGHGSFHIIAQSQKDLVEAVDYYPDAANNPPMRDIAYRPDAENSPSGSGLGTDADSPCAVPSAECLMVKFQQPGLGTKDSITFSKKILSGGAPITNDDLCKAKITYIFSDGYATTTILDHCPAVTLPLISSSWHPDLTVSPRKIKSNVLLAQGTSQGAVVMGTAYQSSTKVISVVKSSLTGLTPIATFTVPVPNSTCSGGLTLCFNDTTTTEANPGTVGGFLATGGAQNIIYENGGMSTTAISNGACATCGASGVLFDLTGATMLTNDGTTLYSITSDDGFTLYIDGNVFLTHPAPESPTTTSGMWTGTTGIHSFELVYGECCELPAQLSTAIPVVATVAVLPCTPDPNNPNQCQATPAVTVGFGLSDADWRQEGGANLQSCDGGATSGTGMGSGTISGPNVTVSSGQTCNFISPCEIQGALTITGGIVSLNCTVDGNLKMTGGSLNLGPSAHLLGNANTISQATSFHIGPNVEIDGGLQINTAEGLGTVCGTVISGNVSVSNSKAAIQIGAGSPTCSANTISGHLTCSGNTPVPSGTNTVGGGSNHCTN